jgi:ribosome-associated translation inhibitor RaiA
MPENKDFTFDFEFYNQTKLPDANYYDAALSQITDLAEGHTDIVGSSVSLEELSSGETPHAYQARVVLYVRPENLAATEVMPDAMDALQHALDAVVKQVRKKRNKLSRH